MKLTKKIRRAIVVFGLRSCIVLFNILPRKAALFIGYGIGLFGWRALPKDRERMDANLQTAYGDQLSAQERYQLGKRVFLNFSRTVTDTIRFRSHLQSLLSLVEVEGKEHLEAAFQKGNGVIGVTGHIGNFELLAAYVASIGYPIAVIGRELYDPRIDEIVVANRAGAKLTQFYTTDSPKKIIGWLRQNGGLGVLIDTDSNKVRNMPIPLFNRSTNTPIGQTILALKTGAALVPMFCVHMPEGKYKVIIRPQVQVPLVADETENIYTHTAACLAEVEQMIVRYPDQWIWQHKRWSEKTTSCCR